ncbi:hypothetical protein, partial [Sphingomonas sp.]|uniref:hypothetical protein n=1 Tax=Sphingomonas sp. TaxID=28214 RepID=UPI003B3A6F82
MGGYIREIVPIGPFEVSLQLPPGRSARRIRLLEADADAEARREGDRLLVRVPNVTLHEVVAVDLA